MEVKVMCDMIDGDYLEASTLLHGEPHRIYLANYNAEDDREMDIGVTPEKAIKFAEDLIDMCNTMIHDRITLGVSND